MKSFWAVILLILVPAGSLTGQTWVPADRIVAVVGDEAICLTELNAYIDFFMPRFPLPLNQRGRDYIADALEDLINRKLAAGYFQKLFVPIVLPRLLVLKKQIIQKRFPDKHGFETVLERNGFTSLTFGEWIKEDYLLIWGVNRRHGILEIPGEDIEQFLETSRENYDLLWINWFSKLSKKDRVDITRDILVSREIKEKLKDLAKDLRKQTRVKVFLE